jgi:hypothetical protein
MTRRTLKKPAAQQRRRTTAPPHNSAAAQQRVESINCYSFNPSSGHGTPTNVHSPDLVSTAYRRTTYFPLSHSHGQIVGGGVRPICTRPHTSIYHPSEISQKWGPTRAELAMIVRRFPFVFSLLLGTASLGAIAACGTEEEDIPDTGSDAGAETGGDAATDTGTVCDGPNPSITCRETGCDAGETCFESTNGGCVPSMCTCDPVTGWMCTADCGTPWVCVPDGDPRERCAGFEDQETCDSVSSVQCEWVEPPGCTGGTADVVLGAAACFPAGSCASDSDCPGTHSCEPEVLTAPRCYWDEPLCDSCMEVRSLCMPRGI